AYLSVARAGEDGPVAVRAWVRAGDLRLQLGDTASAARAYRAALDRDPGSSEAAWGVVETGAIDTPAIALRAFRALDGRDREAAALEAVERFAELSGSAEGISPALGLARARLLVAQARPAEAIVDLRELGSSADGEIAAEALALWARARRRQGRWGDARRIQDRLVEEHPSSPHAVDVVFYRADDRHDRGDLAAAAAGYRRAIEMAPALNRAGQARMRLGQVHLSRGEPGEAAEA
ncbi:MAG: tetratricopeptide repeat protein, partial [Gemmatimonadetes bacterium]|nr:tetratricopeptide repeat protein [Gemmatimonadota bacterium]NIR79797.1 tetratricopeptide repeat protein [Gemmatimonadota bacterium]NIT88500.1 tetratricopeptide repeat protein [Gemmatimonadota bacterium]NIU32323.1 tetratricopeptide repeat protein [Gemmatimonadota bacterium]NIU36845.1 tetratricopeptide repeat protein [Gemmatimonadota bacterium]